MTLYTQTDQSDHLLGGFETASYTHVAVQAKGGLRKSQKAKTASDDFELQCNLHWLTVTVDARPDEIAKMLAMNGFDHQPYGEPIRPYEEQLGYTKIQTFECEIRVLSKVSGDDVVQEIRIDFPGNVFDRMREGQKGLLIALRGFDPRCSRIDLNIDVIGGIDIHGFRDKLEIEYKRKRKGERFKSLITRLDGKRSYLEQRPGSDGSLTVYLGSGDSKMRCYAPRETVLRLEHQVRRDNAERRLMALYQLIDSVDEGDYYKALYGFIASDISGVMDFKTPSSTHMQTSRRPRAMWWRKIVNSNKRLRLPEIPMEVRAKRHEKQLDKIERREDRLHIDKLLRASKEGSAKALHALAQILPSMMSMGQRSCMRDFLEGQGLTRSDILRIGIAHEDDDWDNARAAH